MSGRKDGKTDRQVGVRILISSSSKSGNKIRRITDSLIFKILKLFTCRFDESISGGETIFVDMMQVAENFRVQHPEDFDNLSKIPCPFQRIHASRLVKHYNFLCEMSDHYIIYSWHVHCFVFFIFNYFIFH